MVALNVWKSMTMNAGTQTFYGYKEKSVLQFRVVPMVRPRPTNNAEQYYASKYVY
jgi:hypothetical protein